MGVSTVPKIWGTLGPPHLGRRACVTPYKHTPPPRVLSCRTLVAVVQTVGALLRRSSGNLDPSRPSLQGHSRSLEPTRIDRLGIICIISLSRSLNIPDDGIPLEFWKGRWVQKTGMMPLVECQKEFDDMCIRLDTARALDGQKCPNNIELCVHCMLTRD